MTERLADIGAAVSATGAAVSWVVTVNEYLQLVATVVAIVVGIAAARYHIKKANQL